MLYTKKAKEDEESSQLKQKRKYNKDPNNPRWNKGTRIITSSESSSAEETEADDESSEPERYTVPKRKFSRRGRALNQPDRNQV